ncbi:MAG: efflux RND transporter periplasmic adaptor subunit [Candidatus Competibacteraceae bacterium]|nr:efflux RND transporter periplasmic adaptor subunit [Candidatus Competibacteraceae bacterium]
MVDGSTLAKAVRGTLDARTAWLSALMILALLTACKPVEEPEPEPIRPVRVTTVESREGGETASLTGQVEAREEVNLSFRVGGRMIERSVNVGDRVRAGQVVARLESETPRNALRSARAELTAVRARLVEAQNNFERQRPLMDRGFITRTMFDQAEQAYRTARAQVDSVQAQVNIAETQLGYADLISDSSGTVTARRAEPGEVVAAGQPIVQLAREGGRDAVFDVPARIIETAPANAEVVVVLSSDPKVRTTGRVREVAPQADPVTRTFKVRIGLNDPPAAMRLGSTVTGSVQLGAGSGIEIPASALTSANQRPAVWVLDPASNTVSLRNIEILRYGLAQVAVAEGLQPGDIVVTAGVQTLRPGQQVRLLGTQP